EGENVAKSIDARANMETAHGLYNRIHAIDPRKAEMETPRKDATICWFLLRIDCEIAIGSTSSADRPLLHPCHLAYQPPTGAG
ncbi:hypothetical protein, partial [Bradyrhizobium yuanmingense]|uniref:hypothetical protein n=1 Tax=Bradyrhizobium yuanmingense TaxID=108015 RepID=UPI0005647A00